MKLEIYNSLPDSARQIRIGVFMDEQGFKEEFDQLDNFATHLVTYDGDLPVATCRVWLADDGYHIGRLAVIKQYRNKGLGLAMMQHAEAHIRAIGGSSITLHAQCQALPFYQKCGYRAFGEIDYDEDCPHSWMVKRLL